MFGSYVYGEPDEDSDIDIYVVTNDDFMPQTWRDNFHIKMKYLDALSDITDTFATDIIVHTKKMNSKFLKLNSSFSRKIYNNGDVLYAQS